MPSGICAWKDCGQPAAATVWGIVSLVADESQSRKRWFYACPQHIYHFVSQIWSRLHVEEAHDGYPEKSHVVRIKPVLPRYEWPEEWKELPRWPEPATET